jgi:hypothetical protein
MLISAEGEAQIWTRSFLDGLRDSNKRDMRRLSELDTTLGKLRLFQIKIAQAKLVIVREKLYYHH